MSWIKKLIGGEKAPPAPAPATAHDARPDPDSLSTKSRWERVQETGSEAEITMEVLDPIEFEHMPARVSILGRHHGVTTRQTFGRDPGCHVIINGDREISREHMAIEFTIDEGLRVMDLDSINGTYVNGNPIRKRAWVSVRHGDKISLGSRVHFQAHLRSGR